MQKAEWCIQTVDAIHEVVPGPGVRSPEILGQNVLSANTNRIITVKNTQTRYFF